MIVGECSLLFLFLLSSPPLLPSPVAQETMLCCIIPGELEDAQCSAPCGVVLGHVLLLKMGGFRDLELATNGFHHSPWGGGIRNG